MPTPSERVPERVIIPGSERHVSVQARLVGPASDHERYTVTLRLRARAPLPAAALLGAAGAGGGAPLTREQYAAGYGADPADIARVAAFAASYGLVVVETSVARCSMYVSGTSGQFAAAFGTRIEQSEHAQGLFRSRSGALSVPADLGGIVLGVFGLDNLPVAQPRYQIGAVIDARTSNAADASYTPLQVAAAYDFPIGADGSGECIALIELGGGYRSADIEHYFQALNLHAPTVKTIAIDGGRNAPGKADSADAEVMLDIEVAGAIAPKALIAVYFAPNSEQGFLDAITSAIHDTAHRPSVVSISWGAPESEWSGQALAAYDQAFQSAAALGVTVCCAAGDAGSGDQNANTTAPDGLAHVDFPGSDPYVLCCGGTRLLATGANIDSEIVWDDDPLRSATGGGVSDAFALPAYQGGAGVPPSVNPGGRIGRGVPDVAGNADPATGYLVRVDGGNYIIGGTSAVAPLWAGLVALMNQRLKRPVGFLNPLLYGAAGGSNAFHDIVQGNNGGYAARAGWDACTGWGSPNGSKLLDILAC
ncbi:S53 family peptidase [Rugamonas sp.]|uniref:S53 family peptidase n=1 Tax=Rugamonas sp. TaxID=1926287 RepID=UPI0025EA78B7|nr:S53 family peptidase [Rugamonas sp.]